MNTELMDDVISVSKDIQKEAHEYIDWLMKGSKSKNVPYQDAFNTWLFLKLAATEMRLNEIIKSVYKV